jgi:hypothetical protein
VELAEVVLKINKFSFQVFFLFEKWQAFSASYSNDFMSQFMHTSFTFQSQALHQSTTSSSKHSLAIVQKSK